MNRRQFITAISMGVVAPTAVGLGWPLNVASQQDDEDRLQDVVLSYLSQPKFANSDFTEQITGTKAKLEVYDLDEEMIYFSIPTDKFYDKRTLFNLTKNPNNVEFGKINGNALELGDYVFRKPNTYFFRFPANEFKVDKSKEIKVGFGDIEYNINLEELADYLNNRSIYGGHLNAIVGKDKYGRYRVIANHGAFVAKKGEPSLERLVSRLTSDIVSIEEKSQRLLDFVTNQIEYDETDSINKVEVLKKPNEVLMSKVSDCSGKVILYASLLEQTGIDYYLFYLKDHITVAVEGDFENLNKLTFNKGKKRYSIAETTAEGFQIGSSILSREIRLEDIKYHQKPGVGSKIYNTHTGAALEFV